MQELTKFTGAHIQDTACQQWPAYSYGTVLSLDLTESPPHTMPTHKAQKLVSRAQQSHSTQGPLGGLLVRAQLEGGDEVQARALLHAVHGALKGA